MSFSSEIKTKSKYEKCDSIFTKTSTDFEGIIIILLIIYFLDNDYDSIQQDFFNRKSSSLPIPLNISVELNRYNLSLPGPNINIKLPKKKYSSNDEKNYFLNKYKIKQKTEVNKIIYLIFLSCVKIGSSITTAILEILALLHMEIKNYAAK